jgi:hypothetical protein
MYYPAKEEVWFYLPYGSSQTTMNSVVIYSARLNAWYGPYNNFTRDSAALVDNIPHAGDFAGRIMSHETNNNDDGAAIKASFQTANIAPLGDDVECRWLYARTMFDNDGDYDVSIQQQSSGIVSNTETITMGQSGALLDSTFVLGSSALESDVSTLTSDTDLFGYDPRTMLRLSNFIDDETFTIRRVSLQYKAIGRTRKRKTGIE